MIIKKNPNNSFNQRVRLLLLKHKELLSKDTLKEILTLYSNLTKILFSSWRFSVYQRKTLLEVDYIIFLWLIDPYGTYRLLHNNICPFHIKNTSIKTNILNLLAQKEEFDLNKYVEGFFNRYIQYIKEEDENTHHTFTIFSEVSGIKYNVFRNCYYKKQAFNLEILFFISSFDKASAHWILTGDYHEKLNNKLAA